MSKIFFRRFAFLLLSLLVTVVVLVSTHWGSRLVITGLNKSIANMDITLASSSLINRPVFSSINIDREHQHIAINELAIIWQWHCIWRSTLCIERIDIGEANIKIRSTAPSPKSPMATFNLPFNIVLSTLNAEHISVVLPTLNIEMNQLSLSMVGKQSKVSNIKMTLDSLSYHQTSAENEPTQPFTIENFNPSSLASLMLPTLPMAMGFDSVDIANVVAGVGDQQHALFTAFHFSGVFNNQQLAIKSLTATHPLAKFAVTGEIYNQSYLPHQLTVIANTTERFTPLPATAFELASHGQLDDIDLTINSSGGLKSSSHLTLDLSDQALPFSLSSDWQQVSLITDDELILGAGTLLMRGDRRDYTIAATTDIASSIVPPTAISLSGIGSPSEVLIRDSYLTTLGGNIQLAGSINWQKTWSSALKFTVANIQPHQFWPQYRGNLSGKIDARATLNSQAWSITVDQLNITGTWLDQALALNGKFSGQSSEKQRYGEWDVPNITLYSGDNSLQAHGSMNQEISLDLVIEAPNLAQSHPLLTGNIDGEIHVTGHTTAPSISANLNLNNLGIDDRTLSIEQAQFIGHMTLDAQRPISGELSLTSVKYQDLVLDDVNAKINGTLAQHHVSIRSHGSPWQAQLDATGQHRNHVWLLMLDRANIATVLDAWQLNTPTKITVNKRQRTIDVAAHCWLQQGQQGQLCLTNELVLNGENRSSNLANVTLQNFELIQLNQWLDDSVTISGTLSSTLNLELKPGNKPYFHTETIVNQGIVKLRYRERSIEHHFDAISSQLIIDQHLSSVNLHARSENLGEIGVTLLTDIFSQQPQLTGHIEVQQFSLAPYQALIPDLANIEGMINVSTGFTGDIASPLFFGDVTIQDTAFATTKTPSRVTDLNSQLTLNGQQAVWSSQFTLGEGKGQFNGDVNWQDKLTARLNVNGDKLRLSQHKDLYFEFSPQLLVELTPTLTKVRGDVTITDGLIKVEKLPDSAVALSGDVSIMSEEKQQSVPLDMAINLTIEPEVTLDAFGLFSQLQGKINLTETPTKPLAGYGDLALIDATYQAMGQNLVINKGQLIFTSVLQNPLLNVEAIRDPNDTEDDVIAGLLINGNAQTPVLEIFSTPAMEQQQALSYLLRGKGLSADSSGSSGSSNSMAISMLLNSGIGQSTQFIGDIGDTFGIDDLSLSTSGSGNDTKLEVSGYIAPKLQLRYGVGVFDGTPEMGLRYQLSRQFFVEFVNNTGQALDVLYKFSFD